MNKGLWIARKNHLCCIIKEISDNYGGDDREWLKGHCMEILERYQGEEIETPIDVYQKILDSHVYTFNGWMKCKAW